MIDFTEIVYPGRGMRAVLKSEQLPAGMSYVIDAMDMANGKTAFQSRSQAYGRGSRRYYTHSSYQAALDHGTAWAKRKIAGR